MSKVLRLKAATGKQLQEAAKSARLGDTPNQVAGLFQAIYCSEPSPMQVQILRRGLMAVGLNYVELTDTGAEARTAAEAAETPLRVGLQNMMKVALVDTPTRIVGHALYASADCPSKESARKTAELVTVRGFTANGSDAWHKKVKLGRKTYTAQVEVKDTGRIMLMVYKD